MPKKNNEFYAVISGRVERPTIFSSWGTAHPRVTGCPAVHRAFVTIHKAQQYMMNNGITEFDEVIRDTSLNTTPKLDSIAFYAVAHGAKPGIFQQCGKSGAKAEVDQWSGACYKWFRTRTQAEAFIEDWKESYTEVWAVALREGLDRGLRPHDMKLTVDLLLHGKVTRKDEDDAEEIVGGLVSLHLKEESEQHCSLSKPDIQSA